MSEQNETKVFIGVDVSKNSLDVCVHHSGEKKSFDNNEKGIILFTEFIRPLNSALVVFEATGGLELLATTTLAADKQPVAVVNPRQVRDFAKATGKLAKTDAIDSAIIAHFGAALQPEVRPLKNPEAQKLDALNSRRRQIVEMLTMEKNRLASAPKWTKIDVQAHINWLEKRLDKTNNDIGTYIRNSPIWKEKDEIFQSVKGVGSVLSLSLIVDLPELGTLNRKKIAVLAGVAPLNRDSGKFKGKRIVWGGRAHLRSVLYMGTLVATKHNTIIKAFYQRLLLAGKPKKVAITACMRKLLTILNTMVKNKTKWQEPALKAA